MTPPAVSAPPQPAATKAAAPAPAAELRVRAPLSRKRPERPPLLTARTIGVSLVLHLVLLAAVLLVPAPRPRVVLVSDGANPVPGESVEYLEVGAWGGMATDPSASLPPPAAAPTGLSAAAVDSVLRNLPANVAFPSRVPAGIPQVSGAPGAGQPGGVPSGAPNGVPGGQPGAAGRRRSGPGGLGPELGDPRLVVTPQAVPERELSDEERYQQHFASRINQINDSIAGVADRQRRLTDWTVRDRSGRRWGIDQNGPVVAGRNVPLPVPVPVPRSARDREDEARRERDQRREIDRQADQTERARHLRERQRAIRERADREREKAREDDDDGEGTPP